MSLDALRLTSGLIVPSPAIAGDAPLRVQTLVDSNEFAGLRDEWSSLLAESSSDSLFVTWEWLHTWWNHLRGDAKLALMTVRRGGELVAIAPFASHGANLFGSETLSFLGEGRVGSDYLDVLVRHGAEDQALRAIAAQLRRIGATLRMSQLRITSSAGSLLARELRLSGCPVRAKRTHRCPYIDLSATRSFEDYLRTLGSEHRYNFQRKLRRLQTQHGLRFERVVSESRRVELLPVIFELHRQRWSERGGSDGLVGADILEFHDDLTRVALERGWLRLFVLWLGQSPAATLYGFRYGRVFSFYQSGFDPRFAKLSVGLVALGLAIRDAIDDGVSEFDLLHGEEAYKFHWAKASRRLGRVQAFPNRPLGRVSWAMSGAAEWARLGARRFVPRSVVSALSARARVSS